VTWRRTSRHIPTLTSAGHSAFGLRSAYATLARSGAHRALAVDLAECVGKPDEGNQPDGQDERPEVGPGVLGDR
jgi:hypothetical protein